MVNRLPEKLLLLRKHFGYSQQELADKMGVNVVEYMGWENGRSICNLAQFKRLATIFQVSLDEMLKNNADIPLPSFSIDDSIQIPFMKGEVNEDIDLVSEPIIKKEIKDTAKYNTAPIQNVKEAEKKPTKVIKKVDTKQATPKQKKKENKTIMMIGAAIGIVVVAIGLMYFFNNKGNDGLNLKMSEYGRFAAAEKFTIYIQDNETATTHGEGINVTDFVSLVSVSAHKDFALGLKNDGTVVASGANGSGQLDVKSWKNVVDVAAGDKHSVGVTKEGKVLCAGDNASKACEVSEWADVKDVEAGNGITIGIRNDGSIYVAGNVQNASRMMEQKNIVSAAIGSNEVLFVNKNQTVISVPLSTAPVSDVSSWKNIVQVVAGNNFVAGLGTDGKVSIITGDAELKTAVEKWTDMQVIGANNGYIAGYDTAGKMIGAGDNRYNQYVIEEEPLGDTLEKVKNVTVSMEGPKIKLSWDKIEGADYYLVSINTDPVYNAKNVENSLSIDQSKFVDGQKYVISITACSSIDEKLNSDVYTVDFTYAKATPSPTPTPSFTLTIKYQYADGTSAYPSYTQTLDAGASYSIPSPDITGYIPTIKNVEGKMGESNTEVVVKYTAISTPTPVTPTPTPTPDSDLCKASAPGASWNDTDKKCSCPVDDYKQSSDGKTCEKIEVN